MSDRSVVNVVENTPLGTSHVMVEAYLKKNGYEYSYEKNTRLFRVMIRDSSSAFIKTAVQILIKVDQNEKVTEVVIKQVFTGP